MLQGTEFMKACQGISDLAAEVKNISHHKISMYRAVFPIAESSVKEWIKDKAQYDIERVRKVLEEKYPLLKHLDKAYNGASYYPSQEQLELLDDAVEYIKLSDGQEKIL